MPCEFEIPPSTKGDIDYRKVNVTLERDSGDEEILHARNAGRCDSDRGGWYYDQDPEQGGTPKSVVVCPATCQRFKMEKGARVDLRFGCATKEIE